MSGSKAYSQAFVAHRMEMPAYPDHLMASSPLNDHVPGFAVVGWMTRFPLEHFGDDWLHRGAMEIRYRQHLCVGDPLTINIHTADETMEFEAVRPDGQIVTSGRAELLSTEVLEANGATRTIDFSVGPIPCPPLEGDTERIARQRLGTLEVEFDVARDSGA